MKFRENYKYVYGILCNFMMRVLINENLNKKL